jgi:hypothetical protein
MTQIEVASNSLSAEESLDDTRGQLQITLWCCLFLNNLLKPLVVVQNGLRELKEMSQEVLGPEKLDPEFAGLEMDSRGQVGETAIPNIRSGRNLDLLAGCQLAHPVELFGEAYAPQVLSAELLSLTNSLQLRHQPLPVDEEGFSGLEAPKLAEELDGSASADTEDFLDHLSVDDGAGKGAEFR